LFSHAIKDFTSPEIEYVIQQSESHHVHNPAGSREEHHR